MNRIIAIGRRKKTVLTGEAGQQALDLIDKESFELVRLGIMMPGI